MLSMMVFAILISASLASFLISFAGFFVTSSAKNSVFRSICPSLARIAMSVSFVPKTVLATAAFPSSSMADKSTANAFSAPVGAT